MAQQNSLQQAQSSKWLITGTVTFYMVAALSMVIANKWVLNSTSVPLFFLFTQLLIAVVLFLLCHALGFFKVPLYINWELCKGLAPMVTLNVIGLSFSNFTLKYVDASFYQVARGLVLPFTVLTSFLFLAARPSTLILVACLIVTLGFFVGVFLDGVHVSAKGIMFGVISSATTALHAVVIKKAIKLLGDSALDLGWYSNALSAVAVVGVSLLAGEGPDVVQLLYDDSGKLSTFLWGSAITGVIGFLMSIASLLSIKVTSPITHMVSSAVRGVAASFLGVWVFSDVITSGRATSIAIILGGSIYYTWVKHVESQTMSTSSRSRSASREKGAYERVALDELEAGRKESAISEDEVETKRKPLSD